MITGKDLIEHGAENGAWFKDAIKTANIALESGWSREDAIQQALSLQPPPKLKPRQQGPDFHLNLDEGTGLEAENFAKVQETMREVMKTHGVVAGAVMPDSCPAGPVGTIPVGGVVASKYIHPAMHSADVCCSVAISVLEDTDPAELLDAVESVTHFGPGGRPRGKQWSVLEGLLARIESNPYLKPHKSLAIEHMGTQGDGNHFAFVGTLKSSGKTALVTHHGSRALGAKLYKAGMADAVKHTNKVATGISKSGAWIEPETKMGKDYWEALQIVREWTKTNHYSIHDKAMEVISAQLVDRFWNEHNFVFKRDGLFYHAKGATPAFDNWADDATELTLIPLNMAEPVLIVKGSNAPNGIGFSPHGAGRNISRTQHKKSLGDLTDEQVFADETKHIDARFFMKNIDVSELPSAYKNADTVRAQIDKYGLAEVVDEVTPYGCIMAGEWERDAPWKKKRGEK